MLNGLTDNQVQRIGNAVRRAESNSLGTQTQGKWTTSEKTVRVHITSNASGAGWYVGVICKSPDTMPDGSSDLTADQLVVDTSIDCIIANPAEIGESGHDLDPGYYIGEAIGKSDDNWVVVLSGGGGAGSVFPVLCQEDGGSGGSDTTLASWTYTIYHITDSSHTDPIATGVPVYGNRQNYVGIVPGLVGIACKYSGGFILLYVNEHFTTVRCNDDGTDDVDAPDTGSGE